jgi:hypothetical protein
VIQYPRALMLDLESSGILGRPVESRAMTACMLCDCRHLARMLPPSSTDN